MKSLLFLLLALNFFPSFRGQSPSSPILFIYDASGSMWGQMEGKTKMQIAAEVLTRTVGQLPKEQQLGLVAYGHREEGNCEDVEFLVDMESGDKAGITSALPRIKPLGRTPLAYSALQVIDKLRSTGSKATIILITDGIESCGGNLCEVIRAAKEEGINFRLHIVGFGLEDEQTANLECAALAGDGRYYDAEDASGLADALQEVTAATVDDPSDNISLFAVKNGEPIDAYVKAYAEAGKGKPVARTYRDTAFFHLDAGIYDLEVLPLENTDITPITLAGIEVVDGEINHQDVSFDGGALKVTTTNNDEGWDSVVKVMDSNTGKNVAGGRTYGQEEIYEFNPGTYDIEMQALNMLGLETIYRIEGVSIGSAEENVVSHNFLTGIAMIGAKSGNELVDATVNIVEKYTGTRVGGSRTYTSPSNNPRKFILNPGTYEVILQALGKHQGKQTLSLEVIAGETTEKIVSF